jgi:hypothetical protein
MTGVELKEYLMSIPNFFSYDPNYMVESIDGEIYNHVPTNYKAFIQMLGKIEIHIYYNKHSDKVKWVDFTIGGTNLYACHKLKDMTFETLYTELNKIMGRDQRFIEWSKVELRNYKIDSLYEV